MSGARLALAAALRAAGVVAAALALVGVALAALGYAPDAALAALVGGSVGSAAAWVHTAQKAAPLLLSGLAVALCFRAGVWNIGAEGQLLFGALCATALATRGLPGAPAWLLLPALLAAAAAGGALLGALAGVLRATRGVSEVISTILLNFVAIQLVALAVQGPLQELAGAYPKSDPFPAAARLPAVGRFHAGLALGLLAAAAVQWLVFHSALGFRLRAVGLAPRAARFAGIGPERHALIAIGLGGALAGLAGAGEVAGVTGQLYQGLSAGSGYTAIAVALLARLHPLGVVPAALFFGALEAGAGAMQRSAGVPSVAAQAVQALVILLSVGVGFARVRRR